MSAPPVTLIGAGPVGTLLALLLARRGYRVRLLERRADPRTRTPERGRSINLALAARGIRALDQAGLMPRVAPHLMPMRGRMLHDGRGGLTLLRYGQRAEEVIHSISRELLNRLLIDAAAAHPAHPAHGTAAAGAIELEFQLRCTDVDPDAGTVQLRDERDGRVHEERFALLLAADGAGSAVRQALARRGLSRVHEEELAHDYKELLIPAHAGAYAFEPQALHIWPQGGYMLIALPNADGSFTATLFLPRQGDPGFDHLQESTAVRGFFEQRFPDAAGLIPDLESQFIRHPQGRIGTVHCEGWQAGGRVALLGDAAHAIVPFHGQGLNCGFEDCMLLDRLLDTHEAPQALEQFEQLRRADTEAIAAMALENYMEMRDGVRAPQFARRQELAAELERRFPGRFIPRYSMVMFHPEIPYAQAQQRGARQQRVLDALAAQYACGPLPDSALPALQQLLDAQGL